jgi:hypothetical protein
MKIVWVLFILLSFRQAMASGLICHETQAEAGAEFLRDRLLLSLQMQENQKDRVQQKKAMEEIEALGEKIRVLKLKNGSWEPASITEKRMNVLALESMILMDDARLLDTHFAGPFASTGRSAVRILTSEAIIKGLKERLGSGRLDPKVGEDLIRQEERDLEIAKEQFLAYADKTISLSYVIEVMKETGSVVDVSTLFGGASSLTDVRGKKIKSKIDEPHMAALESVQMERMVEQHTPNEIQERAAATEKKLAKFLKMEDVQTLIARTREVNPQFYLEELSHQQLEDLRMRLEPDWKSTAATIQRRKATLAEQRRLLWALRLKGPQAIEIVTNWIGSVDGKYRKVLKPVLELLGMQYDRAVLRRHLPRILKILSIKNPADQLNELLKNDGKTPYALPGELIVTFIRFTEAREDWNNIQAQLASSNFSLDQKLVVEFDKYEKEAVKRGRLPLLSPEPDPTGAAIGVGMGAGGAWFAGNGIAWVTQKSWIQLQQIFSTENLQNALNLFEKLGK